MRKATFWTEQTDGGYRVMADYPFTSGSEKDGRGWVVEGLPAFTDQSVCDSVALTCARIYREGMAHQQLEIRQVLGI